jgi:hypothetical protein
MPSVQTLKQILIHLNAAHNDLRSWEAKLLFYKAEVKILIMKKMMGCAGKNLIVEL